ncbi:MAG: hypothetical protein COA83_04155 [Methylophaga sp.]|nr:MAG: hypothetical protein COA83_04155 [Methylophaga sp.]
MKSAIETSTIIWTCRPDKLESVIDHPIGELKFDMPCPEEIGSGTVEVLGLNLGMDIAHTVLTPNPKYETEETEIPLTKATGVLLEPMIYIVSVKTGHAILHDHRTDKKYDFDQTKTLCMNMDRMDDSFFIKKGQQHDLIHLKMGESILNQFLGEEVAQSLRHNLNIATVPSSDIHAIPLEISRLLHAAFNSHLTGDIRKIHAQSAVLNYLGQLSHYLDCNKERAQIVKQLKIEEIKNELLTHQGKLPSLDELTVQYGMSATTLSNEFKKLTGKPIHTFIIEHRLDNSYHQLEHTDIAMKILAERIGYSHVNHFISAFKKKFNRTPGSLRY